MQQVFEWYGIKVNERKTKIMVYGTTGQIKIRIKLGDQY